MKTKTDIGICLFLGIVAGIVALLFQIAMFNTYGFVVGMVWFFIQAIPVMYILWIRRIIRRTRQRAEMAARADYEHQQLCRGDMATGIYGAFQPRM